ncbi:salicylate hydroxylase [Xanthomonas arboricola]|uniref:salicylate 1-monooxygenase n=1 Tax=Xanthomonas arboricola TaxID=56448 RepID=UPI00061A1EB7|nr:salicylate 1-monooxygenase [Xanthomonas arboricola]AKC80633.1 salicylate hydroxylase [Xanthomonas arboricola]
MGSGTRPQQLRVAIVGGGIAGIALARGIHALPHIKVDLFESAAAFGEIGAGVSFGANAVRAIEGLGLGEPYAAVADRTPAPNQDIWFEWRVGADAKPIGDTRAPGVGQSSVHRADFLAAIADSLPPEISHFAKRAISIDEQKDGVTVHFADGTSHQADVLFAADGIKSALRDHVLQAHGKSPVAPRFTGTQAFRGLLPTQRLREAFRAQHLDERMIDVPQMFLFQDAHVLTFPVKQGSIVNVVAFFTERPAVAWPAGRPWVCATTLQEMLARFDGCGPAIATLLGCIEAPTLWALHDLEHLEHYTAGRVALIGDAAHAMLPHQGAGAGQGLEDAFFLTGLLADPEMTRDDVHALLQAYEAIRKPRAQRVQTTSWEAGELYEFRAPLAIADPARLGQVLAERFDWIWNHDLQQEVSLGRSEIRGVTA